MPFKVTLFRDSQSRDCMVKKRYYGMSNTTMVQQSFQPYHIYVNQNFQFQQMMKMTSVFDGKGMTILILFTSLFPISHKVLLVNSPLGLFG